MRSIFVSILLSIAFHQECSCSIHILQHLTVSEVAVFEDSTIDSTMAENLFYVFPSEETLLIGRMKVGNFDSTFHLEKKINLTEYCRSRFRKVFRGFLVGKCQQNSLGGRLFLVMNYAKVMIPNDKYGARMNKGASLVHTLYGRRWYYYAQVCMYDGEIARDVPDFYYVDPYPCKHIVNISLPWPERMSIIFPLPERMPINSISPERMPYQNVTTIPSTPHPTFSLLFYALIPPVLVCFTVLVIGLLIACWIYRSWKKFGNRKEDAVTRTHLPNISSGPTGDPLEDHLSICSVHLDSSQTPGGNANHPHSNCSTDCDSQMSSTSSQRSNAAFTLGSALSVSAVGSSYSADDEQSVSLTNTNPSSPSQLSRDHPVTTAPSLSERSSADGASRQGSTPYLSPSVPSSRSNHSLRSLSLNSTPLDSPVEEEGQVAPSDTVVHCQEEWGQNRTSRPAPGKFTSESSC